MDELDDIFSEENDEPIPINEEQMTALILAMMEEKMNDPVNGIIGELKIIEKYYPGEANLTDDELVRRKYYHSLHSFHYEVSMKRMIETEGRGIVREHKKGWTFMLSGSL